MFDFAQTTKNMTATEILNYYRNLYYAEPQVTERGIVANAINDVLPNMVEVVRCKDCKWWHDYNCTNKNGAGGLVVNGDWFCCAGERKDNER